MSSSLERGQTSREKYTRQKLIDARSPNLLTISYYQRIIFIPIRSQSHAILRLTAGTPNSLIENSLDIGLIKFYTPHHYATIPCSTMSEILPFLKFYLFRRSLLLALSDQVDHSLYFISLRLVLDDRWSTPYHSILIYVSFMNHKCIRWWIYHHSFIIAEFRPRALLLPSQF